MIAFDSNVIIYALTGRSEFADPARTVLRRVAAEGGTASVLLIGEVLCKTDPELEHQLQQARTYLMNMKRVSYLPVTFEVAEQAAELVRHHPGNLRLTDAIHIISAKMAGAVEFWTNDKKLRSVTVPGLSVELLN